MRSVWKWLLWAAFVMIGLPFLAVKLAPGDAGMAICFLLFFVGNPLFSVCAGWAAGRFWMPMAVAGLFLGGVWTFFDPGERAFIGYAAVYLVLGWGAMTVRRLFWKSIG